MIYSYLNLNTRASVSIATDGYNYFSTNTCDFTTGNIRYYYSGTIIDPMSITTTIISAPSGVNPIPPPVITTISSSVSLWQDLPKGTYTIRVDYGDPPYCKTETQSVVLTPPYSGFGSATPSYTAGSSCGKYKITGKGWYYSPDGSVYTGAGTYYAGLFDATGTTLKGAATVQSNTQFTINTEVEPGTYLLKFTSQANSQLKCWYEASNQIITIPPYAGVSVDASKSGGTICTAVGSGILHVEALAGTGSGSSNFTYRMKPTIPAGSPYTNFQVSPDFSGVNEGTYIVQINDACGYTSAEQEVQVVRGYSESNIVSTGGIRTADTIRACEKTNISLLLNVTTGGAANVKWTNPSGTEVNGLLYNLNNVKVADSGIYRVDYVYNGCTWTKTIKLIISPYPALSLNMKTATLCAGTSLKLVADTTNIASVAWTGSYDKIGTATGQNTDTLTLNTQVRTSDTSLYVYVTAYAYGVCSNITDSVQITVKGNPISLVSNLSGTESCAGREFHFDFTTTNSSYLEVVGGNGNLSPTRQSTSLNYAFSITNFKYIPAENEKNTFVTLAIKSAGGVCGYLYDTVRFFVLPRVTTMGFELVGEPKGIQQSCVDTVYTLKVKAVELGALDSIRITLSDNHNTNISVDSAEYQYPYNTGVWQKVNFYQRTGTNHTYLLPNRLPGNDSVLVRIHVRAVCGFSSGNTVNFIVNAEDICNNNIPQQAPITSQPFRLPNDANFLNSYTFENTINNTASPFVVDSRTSDTLTVRVKAIVIAQGGTPTDSLTERLVTQIPKGMEFVPGSMIPIRNANGSYTSEDNDDGVFYDLVVPSGLEHDSIIYEFKVAVADAPCDQYNLYAEAYYLDSIDCGEKCVSFNIIKHEDYIINVERYNFSLLSNASYIQNNNWYSNLAMKAINGFLAGDSLKVDFYVDKDSNSLYTPGVDTWVKSYYAKTDTDIPANGTLNLAFSDIPLTPGYQLLVLIADPLLCDTLLFPVTIITGQDTACQNTTALIEMPMGMTRYHLDAISGATRIPLTSVANYPKERFAKIGFTTAAGLKNITGGYSRIINGDTIASINTIFKIYINPAVTYKGLKIANNQTVYCTPGQVKIWADSVKNAGSVLWTASTTAGVLINETTDTLTYQLLPRTNDTTLWVNFTAYGKAGCADKKDSIQLKLYASIQQTAPGDTAVCYGNKHIFNLRQAIGGHNNTYQWQDSIKNGTWQNIVNATNAFYTTSNLTDTTWFRRIVTADCGLSDTTVAARVSINPLPVFTVKDTNVCLGTSIDLTSAIVDLQNAVPANAIFSTDSINFNTSIIPTVYTPLQDSIKIYVRIINDNTCASIIKSFNLKRNPLPVPTLNTTVACSGMTTTYKTQSGKNNYLWTVSPGGTITAGGSATDSTISIQWNTTGTQSISINYFDNKGCTASPSTVVNLTVNALPTIDITTSGDINNLCYNSAITLVSTPSPSAGRTAAFCAWETVRGSDSASGAFDKGTPMLTNTYTPANADAGKTVVLYVKYQDNVCVGYYAYDTVRLRVLPFLTNNTLTLTAEPQTAQSMCTDTAYELYVKATEAGDIKNMKVSLDDYKNSNITILYAETKSSVTGSAWNRLTDSINDLKGRTWILPDTLSGGDSAWVKIHVTPQCGFNGGVDIKFRLNATTLCGDGISEKIVLSQPFQLLQDTAHANTFDIATSFNPSNINNSTGDTVTVHFEIKVNGSAVTDSNLTQFYFFVPKGLQLVPGSTIAIRNGFNSGAFTAFTDATGTEYSLSLASGYTQDSIIIAEVKVVDTGASCGNYNFRSEIYLRDTVDCGATRCTFNKKLGGDYPVLNIQRYVFTNVADSGFCQNGLWSGVVSITAATPTYAGDTILIDFYKDMNNNGKLDAGDVLTAIFNRPTVGVPAGTKLPLVFVEVPFEPGYNLLAVAHGKALCDTIILPIVTVYGPNSVCQGDTTYYEMPAGMQNYNWFLTKPTAADATTGATPIRFIPEGEAGYNVNPDNFDYSVANKIGVRWGFSKTGTSVYNRGTYGVRTSYSLPGAVVTNLNFDYFAIQVNPRPKFIVTKSDTLICAGQSVDISLYFADTNSATKNMATYSYYLKESNNTYTLLANQTPPIKVNPTDTTVYGAFVITGTDCDAIDTLDFTVNINPLPEAAISNDGTICDGEQIDLTFTLTSGKLLPEWKIEYNEGTIVRPEIINSTNTNTIILSVAPNIDTIYYIKKITDGNGCIRNY